MATRHVHHANRPETRPTSSQGQYTRRAGGRTELGVWYVELQAGRRISRRLRCYLYLLARRQPSSEQFVLAARLSSRRAPNRSSCEAKAWMRHVGSRSVGRSSGRADIRRAAGDADIVVGGVFGVAGYLVAACQQSRRSLKSTLTYASHSTYHSKNQFKMMPAASSWKSATLALSLVLCILGK